MYRITTIVLSSALLACTLHAGTARAAEPRRAKLGLTVGAKGALGIPQPFSTLKTGGGAELELGYLLPFLGRRLGLSAALSYGHHGASGQGDDPRLVPGGTYDWDITYQELMLSFGVTGRIFPPYAKIANGYLSVGPRLFFLEVTEEASSGDESFGTHTEQDLRVGVYLLAGGELYLGPGALFLEFEYAWVEVNELITGDADGSALRFLLGYRIVL
jgi:hypothetical protein